MHPAPIYHNVVLSMLDPLLLAACSLKHPTPHNAARSAVAPLMSSYHRHIRGCPVQRARWTWMVCSTMTGSASRLAARTTPSRWVSISLHSQAALEQRCLCCLDACPPYRPLTLHPAIPQVQRQVLQHVPTGPFSLQMSKLLAALCCSTCRQCSTACLVSRCICSPIHFY